MHRKFPTYILDKSKLCQTEKSTKLVGNFWLIHRTPPYCFGYAALRSLITLSARIWPNVEFANKQVLSSFSVSSSYSKFDFAVVIAKRAKIEEQYSESFESVWNSDTNAASIPEPLFQRLRCWKTFLDSKSGLCSFFIFTCSHRASVIYFQNYKFSPYFTNLRITFIYK